MSSSARRPRSHHESDDSCYPCVQVKRERRLPNGQTIVRVLHCPFCGSKTHTHGVTGEVNGTLRLSHCAQVTGESYELTIVSVGTQKRPFFVKASLTNAALST